MLTLVLKLRCPVQKSARPTTVVETMVEGPRQRLVADVGRDYVSDAVQALDADAEDEPAQAGECSDKHRKEVSTFEN